MNVKNVIFLGAGAGAAYFLWRSMSEAQAAELEGDEDFLLEEDEFLEDELLEDELLADLEEEEAPTGAFRPSDPKILGIGEGAPPRMAMKETAHERRLEKEIAALKKRKKKKISPKAARAKLARRRAKALKARAKGTKTRIKSLRAVRRSQLKKGRKAARRGKKLTLAQRQAIRRRSRRKVRATRR